MVDVNNETTVPPTVPEQPEVNAAGRTVRKKRLTWKLLQQLPQPPPPAPEPAVDDQDATPPPTIMGYIWEAVHTVLNSFGIYREFPTIPTHNPDDRLTLSDLANAARPPTAVEVTPASSSRLAPIVLDRLSTAPTASPYFPFANSTIFGLMNWMWNGSALKSVSEMAKLIAFLKSDDFRKEDLDGFDIRKETARYDKSMEANEDDTQAPRDGWRERDVTILVPDGLQHQSDDDVPAFEVPGLHYRPLAAVIKSVLEDPAARSFHYTPFKQYWRPSPDLPPQRIYDEIYSSDAMIEAHGLLQQQPPEPDCQLERVVAALMFWSDSTHLTSFGNASLWPVYMLFGNQSKYTRGKPRTASCHHVAYIPKVCSLSFAMLCP